jgi:hypothetical protein
MAGGFKHTHKGTCPVFDLFYRSGWEHETMHWLDQLRQRGLILGWGYEVTWLALLTNPKGTGAVTLDFDVVLPQERQPIAPWFDTLWDQRPARSRGAFRGILEVKGRLGVGGPLRLLTAGQLHSLRDRKDARSALILERLQKKYGTTLPCVVMGKVEYELSVRGQTVCAPTASVLRPSGGAAQDGAAARVD